MQYSGEGFSIRVLAFDDCELINRYEKANRKHLQPWEPFRDDDYFILENARSRVQQQWESMQSGSAVFFLVIDSVGGELLGRFSYTNIVRGFSGLQPRLLAGRDCSGAWLDAKGA
ncbi:Ribosomal-protein-S5p-alanine acetyltransferase [Pseudomonas savastanoi pv. nerii]|nr:Ribosomal-protein-S5p-alanine acetyltransferase [Pseudomonas savastanoi pv. nerii]RMU46973.1 Ribosomal-protein-S5p-alanine acetyltransferase [Pseudomonas savastanoi pv. nerii]